MKRFLCIFSLALIVVLLALTSTVTLTVSADSGNMVDNVVYISDSAKPGGDGSSPDKPLFPEEHEPEELDPTVSGDKTIYSNYKNTALYQAVEKLAETGGTVVICGDYTLTDDNARGTSNATVLEYHLPKTKKPVTITSKYKDEDYRESAELTLSGHFFTILNGPTVWENLNLIADLAGDRAICCNGNKTVFGEGLNCTKTDTSNNNAYYLSIAGGSRYSSLSSNVDVTIKSGTFYKLVGTTWTNASVTHSGDVDLKIEGGTISYVYGNSHNTVIDSIHSGNVNISIKDGHIIRFIACTGKGGFKSTSSQVNIKISGGTFGSNIKIYDRYANANETPGQETFEGNLPGSINIDLNAAIGVEDTILDRIITYLPEGAEVIYPADWINGTPEIQSQPTEKFVFVGDTPSSKGASVKVEYYNPVKEEPLEEAQIIEYSKNNTAFTVECDTSKAGKATACYKFGGQEYYEAEIDVIAVPEVKIEGVQIRTNTREQQMYGWGNYTSGEYPDIDIKECGVLALPSDIRVTDKPFDHTNSYGMYDSVADKFSENASQNRFGALVFGDEVIRENNYNRDYSLRAYVKIEYNGKEYYRYSDVIERCFYDVAQSARAGDKETEATKSWLKENVIDVHNNYDPTYPYNPEGSAAARQKVVDYLEAMMNVEWTPKETFIIYNEGTTNTYSLGSGSTAMYGIFYAGKTYKGIPYVNKTMGQYENFVDMFNLTNIKPLVDANNNPTTITLEPTTNSSGKIVLKYTPTLTAAQKEAGLENAKNFPGNDCLTGVIFAWNSVLNDREEIKGMTSIGSMINLKNGTITAGGYDYEATGEYFVSGLTRTDLLIKEKIGEQKIAEAYAKLQKGDATAYTKQYYNDNGAYSNGRHVRLIYEAPNVVYTHDSNGKKIIDLEKSTVRQIDQGGGGVNRYIMDNTNEKFDEKYTEGKPSNVYTASIQIITKNFSELINEGALPLTIPELATGNVDTPKAFALGLNLEEYLPNGILGGTIKANKQIVAVKAVLTNTKTNDKIEIKDMCATTYSTLHAAEYNLAGLDIGEKLTSGETYKFDISVCISGNLEENANGNYEIVYTPLVSDYTFTAK